MLRFSDHRQAQAGVRKQDVLVVVHENESPDWSFGNGVAQYL
jgi:hypothetical protein